MKSKFVLLALFAAPSVALAQTQTASVRVAKAPQTPTPKAQELLDNLFAPYAAAKTFRGSFHIAVKDDSPQNTLSEMAIDTQFRYDDKGDLKNENTLMRFVGRGTFKEQQTLRFVNDGTTKQIVAIEQQYWWTPSIPFYVSSGLAVFLKPVLDSAVQALHKTPRFVPVVSRGVDAGRPVFILTAKGSNVFRAVVDEKTRALRSFELLDSVSILGSNQAFDEPIDDAIFAWTPPADARQVAEDKVKFPASLGITMTRSTPATPTD